MSSPYELSDEMPVYVISVAANLSGMHPQTLRGYERVGLVIPRRTTGGGRRYSMRDILALREIQRLSQEEGINLSGIKRILDLERELEQTRLALAEMHAVARGRPIPGRRWCRSGPPLGSLSGTNRNLRVIKTQVNSQGG